MEVAVCSSDSSGQPQGAGSLIDSDVFFESVLKFFIHQVVRSCSAWQDTLINTGKKEDENKTEKNNNLYKRIKYFISGNALAQQFLELQLNIFLWHN